MKKIIFLACLLLSMTHGVDGVGAQELSFGRNGEFKIVQFTDIHWVPGDSARYVSLTCMEKVLDAEKPDLVIITGDFITGLPVQKGLDDMLEPILSRKIPFSITFGNHDDEHDMTRQEIFNHLKTKPGNLTADTPGLSGVGNYILKVHGEKGAEALLYCFDSHANSTVEHVKGYDWIKSDQIDWYKENSAKYATENGGVPLQALAFFHIPLPEFNQAAKDEGTLLVGVRHESACSPPINTGLFAAMVLQKDIMGIFVGHDHVNDYAAYWKGIVLAYGRFTGGCATYTNVLGGNGGRVIVLREGVSGFTSWIRLASGEKNSEIEFPTDFVP